MSKILLIEDEESIRKIIAYDLTKAGYDISEAEDGSQGLKLGLNETFDLMIIDWMLPEMDGVELVKKFRENHVNSIFMMLTAKDEEDDLLEAFEAGVDDYMSKPFSPKELMARVNAHLKRINKSGKNKEFMDILLDDRKRKVIIAGEEHSLTKKEYDLMEYYIMNNNIVLSRDKILNDLWGFDYDGDTRIVDVHTFKLRSKLKNSKAQIGSSRGVGYILEAKDE